MRWYAVLCVVCIPPDGHKRVVARAGVWGGEEGSYPSANLHLNASIVCIHSGSGERLLRPQHASFPYFDEAGTFRRSIPSRFSPIVKQMKKARASNLRLQGDVPQTTILPHLCRYSKLPLTNASMQGRFLDVVSSPMPPQLDPDSTCPPPYPGPA